MTEKRLNLRSTHITTLSCPCALSPLTLTADSSKVVAFPLICLHLSTDFPPNLSRRQTAFNSVSKCYCCWQYCQWQLGRVGPSPRLSTEQSADQSAVDIKEPSVSWQITHCTHPLSSARLFPHHHHQQQLLQWPAPSKPLASPPEARLPESR